MNVKEVPLLPNDALALPSFDSAMYAALLYQLRGTPVVVNIWSSWCAPCRDEAPLLADAAMRYESEVQFLGVDILDERGSASEFVREYEVPYPSVFDADGEIRDRLGFIGQPETLFYDAAGRIAAVWTGPITAKALQTNLAKISSTVERSNEAPMTTNEEAEQDPDFPDALRGMLGTSFIPYSRPASMR